MRSRAPGGPGGYTVRVTEQVGGHPIRAFLFADPAAHSLSPRMHAAAFRHVGLEGSYEAVRVQASGLPAALEGLRQPGVLGANLSLPHKEAALALLDELSPAARAIGAVNTVIHRQGRLMGENTDAPGLGEALGDAGYSFQAGGRVVVLGAGGAARAAVYVALEAGQQVHVVNRTLRRAQDLAGSWPDVSRRDQLRAIPAHELDWAGVSLVINASSAGLAAPEETPLDSGYLRRVPPSSLVYDMVYRPAETRLMREARAAGLSAENGLGMLAHQARLAFLAWTGRSVPGAVFLDALQGTGGSAA